MKKYNVFLSLFILYLIGNMVFFPKIYINATYNGIVIWAVNVLPSILPFIIFTKFLNNLNFTNKLSKYFAYPCKKYFNCPSCAAVVFLTSIISGYPVGATMTADLYQTGQITKSEALKMCSFCSTSGPMFIIGTIGSVMLGNKNLGYIIFLAHILSAILNGLLYRKIAIVDTTTQRNKTNDKTSDFSKIIQDSVLSILSIGAIISIFFVIITSLSPILSILPPYISSVLEGLIEITKGCSSISQNYSTLGAIVACSAIVSFGGVSTLLQSITILKVIDVPIKIVVLQKTTHSLIAVGISIVLCLIFL